MDLEALRATWRDQFGEPPPIRSRDIFRRALADQLQQRDAGVDATLERRLARAAAQHRVGRKPTVRAASYKPGSVLLREWQGERHRVEVVDGGYVWQGERYASLSKIARAITGVRWNGPRFFGLRDEAAA